MNKTKTILIWLFAGTVCAGVLFYLIDMLVQSHYASLPVAFDPPESHKMSIALFSSGLLQLLIGLFVMKPTRKIYHVPTYQKEYRDPFVGLDREELSDHGYGTENSKENDKRKFQGLIFFLPTLVLFALSVYVWE